MYKKVSACIVLINPDGFILGVSRKDNHNDFGLIGGRQDPEDNGDPMVTAIRETKEETGLDITNLRLIFAIHKDGYMGYTYLADYTGKININEPHVVKWVPFETLIRGSFGKYNQLVSESLESMGVFFLFEELLTTKYLYAIDKNNFVHLTSESYWKLNKRKESMLKGEALDDLFVISENNRVIFHNVIGASDEIFLVSRKNGETLTSVDDIKQILEKCGFETDKKFTKYVNENNRIHKV
jgi:hypothetical protein